MISYNTLVNLICNFSNHNTSSDREPDVKEQNRPNRSSLNVPAKNRAGTLNEQLTFWKGQKRKPIKGVSCQLQC